MSDKEILVEIEKDISELTKDFNKLENSRIRVTESNIDEYGTKTIEVHGGQNGFGEWENYFRDLYRFVKKVKEKYDIWLIKMENDCPDDLFYATFGVDLKD